MSASLITDAILVHSFLEKFLACLVLMESLLKDISLLKLSKSLYELWTKAVVLLVANFI